MVAGRAGVASRVGVCAVLEGARLELHRGDLERVGGGACELAPAMGEGVVGLRIEAGVDEVAAQSIIELGILGADRF